MAYLCFDIGSSSLKAAVVSETGELLSIARRPLVLLHGPEGAHETDALAWIEAAFSAGSEAISAARNSAAGASRVLELRAVSVSGNGPSLLPADSSGKPLGPVLSWLDRRAVAEASEVSALAGAIIDPSFYLPKALRHWRAADASERRRLRWFFSCPEYLVFVLCGEAITYLPDPRYEPYIWNSSMLEALDLPAERFPPFAAPGSILGDLSPSAAERLGCGRGAKLVAGYPDFLAAIVGSATVDAGVACDRTGTSEAINLCAEKPFPRRELLSLPHPVSGLWNLSGGVSTAGAALAWLSGLFNGPSGPDSDGSIGALLSEARRSPPGARGLAFLPYLAGERAPLWDSSLRGSFVGLSIGHDRSDLARAVCESLAYGLRLSSDIAVSEGFPFSLVRLSGHSSSDDFLSGIKADVLGVPIEIPEIAECEIAGVAAACALALGEASSISEASAAIVRVARRIEPSSRDAYDEPFSAFTEALRALHPDAAAQLPAAHAHRPHPDQRQA